MGTSGRAAVGDAVRRYCRARLGPVRGVASADRLASAVVAQVAAGGDAPFDREAYRAAVRAVDAALASSGRDRRRAVGVSTAASVRLAAAVEDLPGPVRDVLVLRTFVGLTREEVARALGVSDLTVLRRQHEALRILRVEEL